MKSKNDKSTESNAQSTGVDKVISTAISRLRDLVDVNTVIGEPYNMPDGSIIVPISKIIVGFVAGGGQVDSKSTPVPFAGGSGAGLTVEPIGLVIKTIDGNYKFVPTLSKGYGILVEQATKLFKSFREKINEEEDN